MISSADLVDNAELFGREAVELVLVHGLTEKDWRFVAVFAATALEQLSKAALVEKNVLLLAELRENSVLALAGVPRFAETQRTIGASKAIERYGEFDRRFAALRPDLERLLNARNGVVHLTTDAPEDFDEIINTFLRAVELLAEELDLDEEAFWGEDLLPLVEGRRTERVKTIEAQVKAVIDRAVARFDVKYRNFSDREKDGAIAAAEQIQVVKPGWMHDSSVQEDCPACGRKGWVFFDVDGEWEFADGGWVPHAWTRVTEFHCQVCELELIGDEAEWQFPEVDVPDEVDYHNVIGEPPDAEDLPGYGLTDLHPYPPPS